MAAEIDIMLGGEQWRITGDRRNWALGKMRKNKKGELEHHPEAFFASIEGVIKGVGEIRLKLSNARSFEDLIQELRKYNDEVSGMFDFVKE